MSLTKVSYSMISGASANVLDFGAVGNGTADDTNAIALTFAALAALPTGGTAFFPSGTYKITSALSLPARVNVEGDGQNVSIIAPTASHGLLLDFATGFGNTAIKNIGFVGTTCTDKIAIYRAGTTSTADELYGIEIDGVFVQNFNKAVSLRTVRQVVLTGNCWFQTVQQGVYLEGLCIGVAINSGVVMVYNNGCGTGSAYGVTITPYTYLVGGTVAPEAVRLLAPKIYGFAEAVHSDFSTMLTVRDCDIAASSIGIWLSTQNATCAIEDNYIVMAGAASTFGIATANLGSERTQSKARIVGNNIQGSNIGAGVCSGIHIGNLWNHVDLSQNTIYNLTAYDIDIAQAGDIDLVGNYCNSSGSIASIQVVSVPTASPIYIDKNQCYKTILADNADVAIGDVIYGDGNIINQTTRFGAPFQMAAVFDPPNLADGAGVTTTLTVNFAALGDFVVGVSFSLDLQGITLTAWVSSANTVSIRFQNETGGAIDLASGTLRAQVRQQVYS